MKFADVLWLIPRAIIFIIVFVGGFVVVSVAKVFDWMKEKKDV